MLTDKFISPTYGQLTMEQVVEQIQKTVEMHPHDAFNIMIGTDSQNFDDTKIVLVILLRRIGKGGTFFYQVTRQPRIDDIRSKLFTETQMSLECANLLIDKFEWLNEHTGFDYTQFGGFTIHVDAGPNGKTCAVIPEIVGWVHSCGYECTTKPDSCAASSVADRLSK